MIRSSVVSTFRTGRHLRMCTKCMLFVDEKGAPDPSQYPVEWIIMFEASDPEKKCTHQIESKK